MLLIGGSLLTFQYLLAFVLLWISDVSCPVVCQPFWPACWLDTPDRSSSSSTRVVQDVWDVHREELAVVPEEVVLLLGMLSLGLLLMIFGLFGVGVPSWVYFGLTPKLEVPLKLAALPFMAEVCYGFVAGVWEAELLAAGVLVGCIGSAMVMMLMCIALSTLSTLPLLLSCFFVGASSLWRMCSKVSGVKGFVSPGGMLFWVIGRLYVVMVRVVLSLPFIPGISGFLLIFMVFTSGFLIILRC